jgi:hypothetical protein
MTGTKNKKNNENAEQDQDDMLGTTPFAFAPAGREAGSIGLSLRQRSRSLRLTPSTRIVEGMEAGGSISLNGSLRVAPSIRPPRKPRGRKGWQMALAALAAVACVFAIAQIGSR